MKSKAFSIKKLLLCILCSILVTTFIGFTILFISMVPEWIMLEVITASDNNSKFLIEEGERIEQIIDEAALKTKEQYGEDYPANGILMQSALYFFKTTYIVRTYALTLLTGVVLGTLIYIVAIQEVKGKKLLLEIVVAFIILLTIILVMNWGYQALINMVTRNLGETKQTYQTYIYDIENNSILIPYIVVFVLVYIGNLIRQKILTNRLNKELNKE